MLQSPRWATGYKILVGSQDWWGRPEWLTSAGVTGGTLSEADIPLLAIIDDADEVVREVEECHATLYRKLGIAP